MHITNLLIYFKQYCIESSYSKKKLVLIVLEEAKEWKFLGFKGTVLEFWYPSLVCRGWNLKFKARSKKQKTSYFSQDSFFRPSCVLSNLNCPIFSSMFSKLFKRSEVIAWSTQMASVEYRPAVPLNRTICVDADWIPTWYSLSSITTGASY